jgi:cytoskeletal protein CcmA (bactofilin family)
VIGNDLKIIGQGLKIISRGILQVDGEIEGDVQAAEVIVGEKGQVSGMVAGRQVVVRGVVSGVVCGQTVALQASSHVDGDVHHMSFAIEMGAQFEGRVVERGARETSLRLSMEEEEQFHLQALDGKALHRDNLLARAPPQQRGQRAAPIALMSQR